MPGRLQDEIRQTKPFRSLRQEAILSIFRTAAVMAHAWEQALRPHGITLTQYNALRILRGAGPEGASRHEVASRMVTPVPDVSRLLDRMMEAGLITRARGTDDRRTVRARVTEKGLSLLGELDEPSYALPNHWLSHMADGEVERLLRSLEKARESMTGPASLPTL